MKASTKSTLRSFKTNWLRFLLISSIILVSSILSSGLSSSISTIKKSYFTNLKSLNISDVIIKSTNSIGFSQEELETFNNQDVFPNVNIYTTFDIINDENDENSNYTRYYFYPFGNINEENILNNTNNKLTLIEGRLPSNGKEIVVEQGGGSRFKWNINDTFKTKIKDYEVEFNIVGIVKNPLYSSTLQEPSLIDTNRYVDTVAYFDTNYPIGDYKINIGDITIPLINNILPKNETSIEFFDGYQNLISAKYKNKVNDKINYLMRTTFVESESVAFLSLNENVGVASFEQYINKIIIISFVFPLFFILICSLVISISLLKYIKDERNFIACSVSLGIKTSEISKKYYIFALLSVLVGGVIGLLLGLFLLPLVIFPAFKVTFFMNKLIYAFDMLVGLISLTFLITISLLIVYFILKDNFKESPAQLLLHPAPKPGKKILLERINFIWKRLSFKFKSSIRNISRYKKNSILIVISNLGSSFLLFLGFGLLDNSFKMNDDPVFNNIADPMKIIAFVITLISMLLSSLIVFNLININISQRKRELATLKVLGYKDIECSFYTFREILSLASFGSILGVPIGHFILDFVLNWLDFGSINFVNWYSYIIPFVIIIILTIIVNFIIYPRIVKIDMNDSLKTID